MLYYSIGGSLFTRAELLRSGVGDQLTQIGSALAGEALTMRSTIPERLRPLAGADSLDALFSGNSIQLDGTVAEWKPIGIGKPLSIVIRSLYTGKHPSRKTDMLVTSAVKSWATNDAVARALNYMEKGVAKGSRLSRPSPTRQGTPVIFYTPALTDSSLSLGLELTFDKFPQDAFNQIGDAFASAASIPLFLPAAPFLIAAGVLSKLFGRLGEALVDRRPDLAATEALNFDIGGAEPAIPGFRLLTRDDVDRVDPAFRDTWALKDGMLVSKSDPNKGYNGEIPYFVIALDGREYQELAGFAPAAVTATVLGRFLHMEDGQNEPVSVLLDALRLLNDFRSRREVDGISKRLADPKLSAADRQALETRRQALLRNITEDLFKPPPDAQKVRLAKRELGKAAAKDVSTAK